MLNFSILHSWSLILKALGLCLVDALDTMRQEPGIRDISCKNSLAKVRKGDELHERSHPLIFYHQYPVFKVGKYFMEALMNNIVDCIPHYLAFHIVIYTCPR